MALRLSSKKPRIDLSLPSLCQFRSSKAYLWAIVRQRLSNFQAAADKPLNVLDAACHALITRDMFPSPIKYYGVDIAFSRLEKAFSIKRDEDILLHGDLCKSLPFTSFFNCIVSLNTLSHLPTGSHVSILKRLLPTLAPSGHFILNCSIGSSIPAITALLAESFQDLEIIYFDSFLSKIDEDNSLVNHSNLNDKIITNEINLPNDASLHHQILYLATSYRSSVGSPSYPPVDCTKINPITNIPSIKRLLYQDDYHFISNTSFGVDSVVLFTPKLFNSEYGQRLRETFAHASVSVFLLTTFEPDSQSLRLYILGLEQEWICDDADCRISLNILREIPDNQLYFVMVASRQNSPCSTSLVSSDF